MRSAVRPENGGQPRDFSELKRGRPMRQLNPFPLIAMLIVVLFLVYWLVW